MKQQLPDNWGRLNFYLFFPRRQSFVQLGHDRVLAWPRMEVVMVHLSTSSLLLYAKQLLNSTALKPGSKHLSIDRVDRLEIENTRLPKM
jgi:hypothetical protein